MEDRILPNMTNTSLTAKNKTTNAMIFSKEYTRRSLTVTTVSEYMEPVSAALPVNVNICFKSGFIEIASPKDGLLIKSKGEPVSLIFTAFIFDNVGIMSFNFSATLLPSEVFCMASRASLGEKI